MCLLIATLPPPYDSVTKLLPFDPSGWYRHAEIMEKMIHGKEAPIIIELGTWKGASALDMASRMSSGGVLYAVDHWFIPPYDKNLPFGYEIYRSEFDSMFNQFLSNVIHAKLTDRIIPIRSGTVEAASFFEREGIRADLIYVDAGHDEASVYADLTAYFPLLKENGIMCGDDWYYGEGYPVQKAVKRFAHEMNQQISVTHTGMWIFSP